MTKEFRSGIPEFSGDGYFLERPRVNALLAKALESQVMLICAGEGYGKTCAVSSFLRNRPEVTAWMQVSSQDNNIWHFWENYIRSLEIGKREAAPEMRELGFPETEREYRRWTGIIRQQFARSGSHVIVGDDCHYVKNNVILSFIDRILMGERIPNHTTIFISRSEPDLNLLSILSKGRLVRIDAEDLLFTREETAAYFRLRNLDLSDEEITAIHRDIEGWPLGLNMAANEIQKNGGRYTRSIVLEKGAFRSFEEDLFAAVPEELQSWLIQLSLLEQWPLDILERIAADLPEQYRGLDSFLSELEKLGALVRYDYYLRGYRIHQVFLDYLREKQGRLSREQIQRISRIAAGWYRENNLKMDAALNYERAGDYAALVGIVNSFPRYVPKAAALALLDIVERLRCFEEDGDCVYLHTAVRGRLLMSLSRYCEAAAVFREAITRFESIPVFRESAKVLAECWNFLGSIIMIQYRVNLDGSFLDCFKKANHYYRQYPFPVERSMVCNVIAYVNQVSFPAAAGEFERLINTFTVELSPGTASPLNSHLPMISDLARMEIAYFRGELNTAERHARNVFITARAENQPEIEIRALYFLLRITLNRDGIEDLLEVWKQKDLILAIENYYIRDLINDVVNGWLYAQLGEPGRTAPWLRGPLDTSEILSMFHSYESLVKAKYLYAEKQFAEAAAFLSLKENKEGLGSFLLGQLEMGCLEAAARLQMGEETAAVTLLENAYQAALSNSIVMPFIELGYDMRLLSAAALSAGTSIPQPWLDDIRNRASAYGKNLATISEQFKNRDQKEEPPPIYLTRQERTILKGLSRGQTREEIAAATGQPLSVVKSLISRIYDKLGAVNRADAVRIGTGMGILK